MSKSLVNISITNAPYASNVLYSSSVYTYLVKHVHTWGFIKSKLYDLPMVETNILHKVCILSKFGLCLKFLNIGDLNWNNY